uniref:Uncharacterized protein n=1 Tax=Candidatus Kentrum sp. LFY TaxID=2126342 RepID=A0A450WVQ9_9GAMM|nr:MAG: hypothetical protein BECKLFY1418C_GA0070996_108620 [Candidatus Kentron sp. LFY]
MKNAHCVTNWTLSILLYLQVIGMNHYIFLLNERIKLPNFGLIQYV